MFKLGVCTRRQLDRAIRGGLDCDNVSYALLRCGQRGDRADVAVFEHVVRSIRLANGVYRTTYRHRMADLDEAVAPLVEEAVSTTERPEFHDWAASDCLAASEWAIRLHASFPGCVVTASDLTFYLLELSRANRESFVVQEDGSPLQYIKGPFVVSFRKPISPVYAVNRLLLRSARRQLPGVVAAARAAHWASLLDTGSIDLPPWRVERIPLLHPEAMSLARRNAAFRLELHSVFTPRSSPVNVIRTVNILNNAYFTEDQIRVGIRAVFDSLVEGGLWIVGRTKEELAVPENHATVWAKTGEGFAEVFRLRSGSEIAELVRAFQVKSAGRAIG